MVGGSGDAEVIVNGVVRRTDILAYRAEGCADLDVGERGHTAVTA